MDKLTLSWAASGRASVTIAAILSACNSFLILVSSYRFDIVVGGEKSRANCCRSIYQVPWTLIRGTGAHRPQSCQRLYSCSPICYRVQHARFDMKGVVLPLTFTLTVQALAAMAMIAPSVLAPV